MRIAICDDETVHLDLLEKHVRNCSLWSDGDVNVTRYEYGRQLLDDLQNDRTYDYIFLDIDMPELTGIELSNMFPADIRAEIIFVSSHMRFQPEVDRKYPAMLISKSYTQDAFDDAIRAYKARIALLHQFKFYDGNKEVEIPCKDIYYITMSDHHLMINTNGQYYNIVARQSLQEIDEVYRDQGLYCCHKSYLINLRYYHSHDFKHVYLKCNNKVIAIPLSRGRGNGNTVKAAYLNFVFGDTYEH